MFLGLTFIATDPQFQNRGAGTLLSQWGIERARNEGLPVYLESTIPASHLYRKLGFVALDGLTMVLPSHADGSSNLYEEVCMLLQPDNETEGMDYWDSSLNITSLKLDYEAGMKPQTVVQAVYDRIDAYEPKQPYVWLHVQPIGEVMRAASELLQRWPVPADRPPLWGVPFSVMDNMDVAGTRTTNACPSYFRLPSTSASVVERCVSAGALLIGKTNMDQLAIGLTGSRSLHGALHSTFSDAYIAGGSSSGSAISVSEGLVSFSIGSDTTGSIRVPALFNGIVGFKPTKGTVSDRGVTSLMARNDTVGFVAINTADAEAVWKVCVGFDPEDPFAKSAAQHRSRQHTPEVVGSERISFKFGVPPEHILNESTPLHRFRFNDVVAALTTAGGKAAKIDWTPFAEGNRLLSKSSLLKELLTSFPDGWYDANKEHLLPSVKDVFEYITAIECTATDVFRDLHTQAACKRQVESILTYEEDKLTVLVIPTAPFHPTVAEVEKDPVGINTRLMADYQHFGNLLDLTSIAVPCGIYGEPESQTRLPFGVTFWAGSGLDQELLRLTRSLEEGLRSLGDE